MIKVGISVDKIAIYTIVSMNYGNRLQNYALSRVLHNLGYEVETIRRYPVKIKWLNILKKTVRSCIVKDKFTNFYLFDKKIKWSDCFVNQDGYSKDIEQHYDAFVIGSDQVWNLTFGFINENSFLPFVKTKRKISYAASFGVDSFDEKFCKQAEALHDIAAISVREETGAEIARQIIGKPVEVLVDPTMLLTREAWAEIAKKPFPGMSDKRYIFLYFLGNISEKRNAIIQRIAQKHGFHIHSVLGSQATLTNCGPAEFVYLISHAALVLTDSFHACVFSIIFQKPFAVFDRESNDEKMTSRIITLLQRFDLEDRYLTEETGVEEYAYLSCSFAKSEQILTQERARAESFLKRALEGNKLIEK